MREAILTGQHHPGATGCTRITIGHMGAGAFVVYANEVDIRRIVQRIEHLHRGRSNQPENKASVLGFVCGDGGR